MKIFGVGTSIMILTAFLIPPLFLEMVNVSRDAAIRITVALIVIGFALQMLGAWFLWRDMHRMNAKFHEQLGRTRAAVRRN